MATSESDVSVNGGDYFLASFIVICFGSLYDIYMIHFVLHDQI